MENKMSIDDLKFVMQRVDLNVDRTNTKATILIGITTFTLGSFAQNINILKIIMSFGCIYYASILISILGLAITSYYAITAIIPIFPKKNTFKCYPSLIYYGSISKYEESEYLQNCESATYSFKEDLCRQVVENSSIAYSKFIKLEKAFRYLIFTVIFPWFLILVLILAGGKI